MQLINCNSALFSRHRTGTHLFVKAPRLGDCEGTFSVFESSCHMLLPV